MAELVLHRLIGRQDQKPDRGTRSDAIVINHHYGYDGDINIGYDLGAFRIEAEGSYKHANIDSVVNTNNSGTPFGIATESLGTFINRGVLTWKSSEPVDLLKADGDLAVRLVT